ncbi:CoA transferase subunit A [Halobacterium sp. KA-4]|uniref:CoA transferase subunit A n=1 Tax=Halobacterium sp. KA-4 TaxID=2896367 RepID=UPI001E2C55E2|nr:CoA-transferase [Halobacterium sp. KA-4]MCD2201676.1 CoA transferase subunit A [Halobacterium sp. KA-4]
MTVVTDMADAVSSALSEGDMLYLGGFTHLIPFAAGHEVIRQEYEDLHIGRATPDLIFDRMIAAGCASEVTFSYAGNPGVGSLRAFRRAVEEGVPNPIEIDEYSHFGMISRLSAGAQNLPFVPLRTFVGSDYPEHNDHIRMVENPYESEPEEIPVVPPLNPDVTIIRAQRADENGNAQVWGITGDITEAAFAADTVVLAVEELVDEDVIRSDPNRTIVPGSVVDYVVEEPYGSHPSYAQGYYDRDNQAYIEWDEISQTQEGIEEWLDEWVYGVETHADYLEKLDTGQFIDLLPKSNYATPIDVGDY